MPFLPTCLRRILALGAILATLAVGLDLHWHPPCLDNPDACCPHDAGGTDDDTDADDGQHCHCMLPAMLAPPLPSQPTGLTQRIRQPLPVDAVRPPRLAHAPDPPPIRAS